MQNYRSEARDLAVKWAQELLRGDFLILDTETTGLDTDRSEIVEISIIDSAGEVLLNTRVKPTPAGMQQLVTPSGRGLCARDIHGIGPEQLEGEPDFTDVYPALSDLVRDRLVIIYNASYDWQLLQSLCMRNDLPTLMSRNVECAMHRYAEWFGDWNDYHQSFRWQKLEGGDHSALGDCVATLKAIKQIAGEAERA